MKTKTMTNLLRLVLIASGAVRCIFLLVSAFLWAGDRAGGSGVCVGLLAVPGVGVAVCAAHLRGDDPRMAHLRQHQRPRRSFYPEEFP